jgi:prevent-host-death family protein
LLVLIKPELKTIRYISSFRSHFQPIILESQDNKPPSSSFPQNVQLFANYANILYRKEVIMPTTWKLEQARAHFSELVERAQNGETQLVTKHGQPAVYIIAAHQLKHSKPAGTQSLWDVLKTAPRSIEDLFERDSSPAREIDL